MRRAAFPHQPAEEGNNSAKRGNPEPQPPPLPLTTTALRGGHPAGPFPCCWPARIESPRPPWRSLCGTTLRCPSRRGWARVGLPICVLLFHTYLAYPTPGCAVEFHGQGNGHNGQKPYICTRTHAHPRNILGDTALSNRKLDWVPHPVHQC